MKKILIASIATLALNAWAQSSVKIEDAWVRGTVAQQKATGAFMRLTAQRDTRLVAASSPVAGVVEIHEMSMDNGVMKMRPVAGLELPAGRTVELKPGGYHVMLMDLKAPLAKDTTLPMTLTFQNAKGVKSTQEIKVLVGMQPPAMPSHDHGTHNHGEHQHGEHKH